MSKHPDWYEDGLPHIWLPYTQMKTASPPLAAARTDGTRITLADGRELVDGIASWWTACHGYNHPHIRKVVQQQLETMPHVMLGGLVHEQALTLAKRLCDLLPEHLDRVFFSAISGSVAVEVAMKMATQYWLNQGCARPHQIRRLQGRLSRRHLRHDGGVRSRRRHARALHRHAARALSSTICRAMMKATPRSTNFSARHADELAGILVEPLVQGAGGMMFHDEMCAARACARLRTSTNCC